MKLLAEAGVKAADKLCIGTVKVDLHDIGKNPVRMMPEARVRRSLTSGTDVGPEAFVANGKGRKQLLRVLLTTTMGVMGDVVKTIVRSGEGHDRWRPIYTRIL